MLAENGRFSRLKKIFTDHLILLSNQLEIPNDSHSLSDLGYNWIIRNNTWGSHPLVYFYKIYSKYRLQGSA